MRDVLLTRWLILMRCVILISNPNEYVILIRYVTLMIYVILMRDVLLMRWLILMRCVILISNPNEYVILIRVIILKKYVILIRYVTLMRYVISNPIDMCKPNKIGNPKYLDLKS